MVNNAINVSAYEGTPPSESSESRIYIEGPLYPVDDVLKILDLGEEQTHLWTSKCRKHVQSLALDMLEVQALVRDAIVSGKYLKSEWCVQKPTGPWAACDGYHLFRDEWLEHARIEMRFEYYVKFAIGKTGKILLLVSCHTSN